jgi:hypothetical protein
LADGALGGGRGLRGRRRALQAPGLSCGGFGLPDAPALLHGVPGEAHDLLRLGGGEQRAGVALGELAGDDVGEHVAGKLQEAQGVGDGRAVFADAGGELLLGVPVVFEEALVGGGGLDGVEVLPLEVFDEGELEGRVGGGLAHHHGNLAQPGPLARAPPAARRR